MSIEYKAAIIGCGRMSRFHIEAYREVGIPIVAAADISQEALEKIRTEYNIEKTYTDYIKMLDEVCPDIVSIVTPEALHCEMVVAAAQKGVKGIVCEKPMAMNLEEAQRMLKACYDSGTKLVINHQRYYSSQYAKARQIIEQGSIGNIRFIEAFSFYQSIFTDGTHTIHMILALLGNPKPVYLIAQIDGNSDYRYYGHRCDHAGNAFLVFENKVYAHLTWGGLIPSPPTTKRLHPLWDFNRHRYHAFIIHGETGRLELDGDFSEKDEPSKVPSLLRIVRGQEVEKIDFEWPMKRSPIALEIADLISSIEDNKPHPLSGENGYMVTEIIMGIYESSRRRGVVSFPVEVKGNPFLSMCEEGVFPR